jgi:hypothetical protein
MQVYKRAAFTLVKGLILALFAPVAGVIILSFITQNVLIQIAVAAALLALMVWMVVFGENIRFEVDTNGRLRYYKRGKLKNEFELARCMLGYHRRTQRGVFGNSDIHLQISETDTGKDYNIDCSPLGASRFNRMYETIDGFSQNEKPVLKADAE